mmetsp:Transcript_27175/g.41346  ORF Transcript_27175/g.41346 Transcript_27175/m.41346 type:complete len:226 (-) Transcript_27175:3681-4358(-)
MQLCYAIARSDELNFFKLVQKMQAVVKKDPQDKICLRILKIIKRKSFKDVKRLIQLVKMRDCFNDSLCESILRKVEVISFGLVAYAKENMVQLTINTVEMEFLIRHNMFALIESLVQGNSLIKIDSKHLNSSDLMQVQQIRDKKVKMQQEQKSVVSSKGGGVIRNDYYQEDADSGEFEGGDKAKDPAKKPDSKEEKKEEKKKDLKVETKKEDPKKGEKTVIKEET